MCPGSGVIRHGTGKVTGRGFLAAAMGFRRRRRFGCRRCSWRDETLADCSRFGLSLNGRRSCKCEWSQRYGGRCRGIDLARNRRRRGLQRRRVGHAARRRVRANASVVLTELCELPASGSVALLAGLKELPHALAYVCRRGWDKRRDVCAQRRMVTAEQRQFLAAKGAV